MGAASRQLPSGSAFRDLAEAQRWLVELYAAFDHTPGKDWIDIVRIRRGTWDVRVVDDSRATYEMMEARTPFTGSRLDSVFLVGDVPYRWHRLERRPL